MGGVKAGPGKGRGRLEPLRSLPERLLDSRLKLILATVAVRLVLAPFFAHIWDANTVQSAVYATFQGTNIYELVQGRTEELRVMTGNPSIFYEGYAYLPHALLIFYPFYLIYLGLGFDPLPIKGVTGPDHPFTVAFASPDVMFFLTMIKLPIIALDVMIVLLLAGRDRGAAALYALSPFSIFITGVWGMFDSLVAFSLLASMLASGRGRAGAAGFLYGIALTKFYPIAALPAFLIFYLKGGGSLARFLAGVAVSQAPTLVALALSPKAFIDTTILFHTGRVGGGLTPLNVTWLIDNAALDASITGLASVVGIVIYAAVVYALIKAKHFRLEDAMLILMLVWLIFGKIVNEQYVIAILPLLLLRSHRKGMLISYIPLIFSFANATPLYFALPLADLILRQPFIPLTSEILGSLMARILSLIPGASLFMHMSIPRYILLFSLGVTFFVYAFTLLLSFLRASHRGPASPVRLPDQVLVCEVVRHKAEQYPQQV